MVESQWYLIEYKYFWLLWVDDVALQYHDTQIFLIFLLLKFAR
jgi:hypothetical protein